MTDRNKRRSDGRGYTRPTMLSLVSYHNKLPLDSPKIIYPISKQIPKQPHCILHLYKKRIKQTMYLSVNHRDINSNIGRFLHLWKHLRHEKKH